MAILREGFRYTVKYVKKRNTRIGTATDFQIGDKLDDNTWINFSCTAFDDLSIGDGDRVKIKHIGSVEIKPYKDKLYYNAVVDVEQVGDQEEPYDL